MNVAGLMMLALLGQAVPVPAGPALSVENLQKLRKIALTAPKATNLDAPVVKLLSIATDLVSVKQFKADTPVGRYVFTVPVKAGADELLLSLRDMSGTTYTYLTDGTRTLRAAMVSDSDGNRSLPNDAAAAGFQDSLKAWNSFAPRVKLP